MRIILVNDTMSVLGTRTLWHLLADRLGARGVMAPFSVLASVAAGASKSADLLIRNAAYFGPIESNCPQIAFVQDVSPYHDMTGQITKVCNGCDLVVYNSTWTASWYSHVETPSVVIPIGVDFNTFKPNGIERRGIVWVGSDHSVKGHEWLCKLIRDTGKDFHVVYKTMPKDIPPGVSASVNLTHAELADVMASSRYALCTSSSETQHLAGIEAGACGTPIITTRVGAYYNLEPGPWGRFLEEGDSLEYDPAPPETVRDFWRSLGYDEDTCAARWATACEIAVCGKTPARS